MTRMRMAALILAAGESKRLGFAKALVQLHSGETLLHRAVLTVTAAGFRPFVTTPFDLYELDQAVADTGAGLIKVPNASDGMSASIRTGVAALSGNIDALLILPVDLWRVTASDLRRLAFHVTPNRAVAASHGNQPGAPAIFPASVFGALATLSGDRGARMLLRSGDIPVKTLCMPSAERDIDTLSDLVEAKKTIARLGMDGHSIR